MRGAKKKNSLNRALRKKRLLVLLSLVVTVSVIGFVGLKVYPPFLSQAATVANPPLTRACGLDVVLLIDGSASMNGAPYKNAQEGMKAFASALSGTDTYIAVRRMDGPESKGGGYEGLQFSKDTATVLRNIDAMQKGQNSYLSGLGQIQASDPRPDRQNLIIVLSDFEIEYDQAGVNAAKQSGTRILALVYNLDPPDPEEDAARDAAVTAIAGPTLDTGSIFTSDVVYVDPSTIYAQFQEFARQLCFSGATPGVTPGPGGPGPGVGPGSGGAGTGTNGQGSGVGGGGGSSATIEADKPNATPAATGQGDATEQPEVEPSPFFDGRLFSIGSDSDGSIEKDKTVGIGGLRIGYGWLIVVGLLLVGLAGYFFWWRRLAPEEQLRVRRKLLLKK